MRRSLASLICSAALAVAQPASASVTLTWLGQSTFVMTAATGLKARIDPTNPGMYKPALVGGAGVVTVGHEHGDHNYVQMATGGPAVNRGLAAGELAGGRFRLRTVGESVKVLDESSKVVQAGHPVTPAAGKPPAERTVMVMNYE